MAVRIDKFLWCVRLYKTRSDATDAVKNNKVLIDGQSIKPSKEVTVGNIISIKKPPITYSYRIKELIANRQGAKLVHLYIDNVTPPEELIKLELASLESFAVRDRGAGRPTKRDRRDIETFLDDSDL